MKRFLVTLFLAAQAFAAGAQDAATYPSKPIRIILGYAPGGANDFLMRLVAAKLQETWGQPVLVENRAGANSIIALEAVAKAPADGYTLMLNGTGGLAINPSLYAKLPYDPVKSYVSFGPLLESALVLAVNPSVPAKTMPEFLAWAKASGGTLSYASASTSAQIGAEVFLKMAGLKATHIPYKGGGEVVNAVIGGTVPITILDSVTLSPYLKSGQIRGLAVSSSRRIKSLPELPTLAEAGIPDFEYALWQSMFAPAGTPGDVVAKLNTEVNRIFALPEVRERLAGMGAEVVPTTSDAVAARTRTDIQRNAIIVRATGMTVQ